LGATSLIFFILGAGGGFCIAKYKMMMIIIKKEFIFYSLLGLRSRFGRLVISFVRDAIESSITMFIIGGGGSILLSSVVSFMTFNF
jgi:hypothetical protein